LIRSILRGLSNDGVTVAVAAKTSIQPRMAPGASIARPLSARHIEDMLELGHGFSHETLATLVLNGLAMVMTETLSVDGATIKIERMRITDAGRRAIRG